MDDGCIDGRDGVKVVNCILALYLESDPAPTSQNSGGSDAGGFA